MRQWFKTQFPGWNWQDTVITILVILMLVLVPMVSQAYDDGAYDYEYPHVCEFDLQECVKLIPREA